MRRGGEPCTAARWPEPRPGSRGAAQCPVPMVRGPESVDTSAPKSSIRRFVIMEKAPTRAFSWLKAAATAFTFKTLLRHYGLRFGKHSVL